MSSSVPFFWKKKNTASCRIGVGRPGPDGMPSAAVGLHRSEPACGRLFGPPWAGWENGNATAGAGAWRTRPTQPDILDRPVGFLRRGISLCSSFPSTTVAADPPSGFKMLRSIASRASRLARSTACKPPGFRRTDEALLEEYQRYDGCLHQDTTTLAHI